MNSRLIKVYLTIVTVLLVIGISLGVYVWYMLQEINSAAEGVETPGRPASESAAPGIQLEAPIVVDTAKLPESQRKVLETVGLGDETFTITQGMVTCAEDALGSARVEEILGGAAPSPIESLKLLPCVKR